MAIKDTFNDIKKQVLGVKTDQIDDKLDKAVKSIVSYRSQSSSKSYIDMVKTLISKQMNNSSISTDANSQMFGQGAPSPAAFGQSSRLQRYKTYDAIVTNINYCYRALNVLTDNILSPDDITKISLEIKPKSFSEDDTNTEARAENVKEAIRILKIEEAMTLIVKNTLMFGDFFCEIADSKEALTNRSLILEGLDLDKRRDMGVETINASIKHENDNINLKFNIDYRSFNELVLDKGKNKKETKDDNIKQLEELSMVFHEPTRVVKLQSDMFPICFGYLVFPRMSNAPSISMEDDAVNNICISILKNLQGKIPEASDLSNVSDLKDIMKFLVDRADLQKAMEIRYVPPNRMEHFQVPSTKYYPYGESIFDSVQYMSKVLMSMETALAIQRLSRSTEKRKIEVEIGLPRDARKVIEEMKETFNKRKISLDSFGSVDTIPSMITTFEDIYLPMKDGKKFVDVSTFTEGNIDMRSKTDELKFMRDSLVASLGIPASFLNIEENLSNKAALSEENILFARTIISHQKYFTSQVNKLIEKIFFLTSPEDALTLLDNVNIAFAPPKSLQFEREARYISEITNLIRSLEEIGIPKEYAKRKYLTSIDWDDLKKYMTDEKIEATLKTGKEEDDALGGMGGMGGGF